jgi:AcrR family transcriptional regulator
VATRTEPAHATRLTGGLAASIAEKGYGATTIADVVRHARVSKRTFYEHFAGKEECFLALYEEVAGELLEVIADAAAVDAPWEERLVAAARAYFERLASEPGLVRAALVGIQSAGPRAAGARREVQRRYADLLQALSAQAARERPDLRPLSPTIATAVVGGLNELVLQAVELGRESSLAELSGAAAELIEAVTRR